MKKNLKFILIPVSIILFTSSLWAQNFTLGSAPEILVLEKIVPTYGDQELRHVRDNPFTLVKILFAGDEVNNFYDRMIQSEHKRIACDGDFSLVDDFHGNQYILVETIKVCIDEHGWVIAHSFGLGRNLGPEEIVASVQKIQLNLQGAKAGEMNNQRNDKAIPPRTDQK